MKLKDKLKDSYIIGVLFGLIIVPGCYLLTDLLRAWYTNYKGDPYLYPPPAAQLFSLIFSVLIFRFILINLQKEKTAKGYFMVVTLSVLFYFFIYRKMQG